jgi:hypothetical protein
MSTGNHPPTGWIAVSIALLLGLAACTDQPTSPGASGGPVPGPGSRSTNIGSRSAIEHPGEAAFEQVSKTVPSFAGYYLEGDNLIVAVTDSTRSQAAEGAVRQVLAASLPAKAARRLAQPSVVGRHAQYTFLQLRDWRDQIEQGVFFALDDAASIDLDEVSNRVVIGLATGSRRAELEQWLARSVVPHEAVKIQIVGRTVPNTNLTDYLRPVMGGLANTATFNGAVQATPLCTFGFNGQYQGTNVVVTNSHCTSTLFGNDATPTLFYQNIVWPGDLVGNEWYDPPSFCVFPGTCGRYSDAAMIAYGAGVSFQLASIARPLSHSDTWGVAGSVVIDASNPHFNITGEQVYPVAGDFVDKVGYKTGWTRGRLNNTCVDVQATDGGWRFCSDKAAYFTDHGDSGSPVFTDPGDGNSITLVGINWGSDPSQADFSPLGGIRRDFGFITTFNPPLIASMTGPSTARPNVTCTWRASATGGTMPYTYEWRRNTVTVGSGNTYTANTGSSGFYLQVLVTDAASGLSQAARQVTVSSGAPAC